MVHLLDSIENYAKINKIPIMLPDGIEFLEQYIKENNLKKILEIGTAIGYSAIRMCVNSDVKVTTIERDSIRYEEALKNIKKATLENQITVINEDALDVELKDKYDLIFIDAAKSQYIKFFEKFKNNLNNNGTIISDNLNFHGLTHQKERIQNKNVRQLVSKINKYIDFLKENKEFKTTFYDIGDGIGVTRRDKDGQNKIFD